LNKTNVIHVKGKISGKTYLALMFANIYNFRDLLQYLILIKSKDLTKSNTKILIIEKKHEKLNMLY